MRVELENKRIYNDFTFTFTFNLSKKKNYEEKKLKDKNKLPRTISMVFLIAFL